MNLKETLSIGTYESPTREQCGYSGWIEPKDESWILWFDLDGRPSLYNRRRDNMGGTIEKLPEDRVMLPKAI